MKPTISFLLIVTLLSPTTAQVAVPQLPTITQEDVQKWFAEQLDRYHFENLARPDTYQRISYDVERMIKAAQNPNAPKTDDWTPSSWSDIFGPRTKPWTPP
ncbi:unnamed protein product [Bursaphelenchus okinawaensis]|uniref:Uncharacterized protein n=1 Tax=Bursaphelenchus okinawaensis TaxID=465554 RepID=A0A811LCX3_9BILA|nr:unnamed protein product [Bursaphelenchus okinawaensis]CAG9120796.1 unnamed protein product [Bursaphelenchus okinawaensis]